MKLLHKIFILLIISSITLTGCWDQKLFEQTGLILAIGIEESNVSSLSITFAYPVIGAMSTNSSDVVTEEVTLLRSAREKGRLSSPKMLEAGKIQEILISDSLAEKGIHDLLEVFQRDATSSAVAYVAVVEGSPRELINTGSNFKDKPKVGLYLYQLLENNSKSSHIPNTKVFDFDINFFAPGLDPITPLIKLENDAIRIKGSALFSKDKMTGKLDTDHTTMLLGMMGQLKHTVFIISDPKAAADNPDKYGISVTLRNPNTKIRIDFDEDGKPIIDINMKYECVLEEYKWNKTNEPKEQEALEKLIGDHLHKLCHETINQLQEANCDPIGFGNMIRAKYNEYWKSISWDEIYKEATIKIDVKAEIVKEGIIK